RHRHRRLNSDARVGLLERGDQVRAARRALDIAEGPDRFLPDAHVLVVERPVQRALDALMRDPAQDVDDVPDHVPAGVVQPFDQHLHVVPAGDGERLAEGAPVPHLVDLSEQVADRRGGRGAELHKEVGQYARVDFSVGIEGGGHLPEEAGSSDFSDYLLCDALELGLRLGLLRRDGAKTGGQLVRASDRALLDRELDEALEGGGGIQESGWGLLGRQNRGHDLEDLAGEPPLLLLADFLFQSGVLFLAERELDSDRLVPRRRHFDLRDPIVRTLGRRVARGWLLVLKAAGRPRNPALLPLVQWLERNLARLLREVFERDEEVIDVPEIPLPEERDDVVLYLGRLDRALQYVEESAQLVRLEAFAERDLANA